MRTIYPKSIITKNQIEKTIKGEDCFLIKSIVGNTPYELEDTKVYKIAFFRAKYEPFEVEVDGEVITKQKLVIINQKDKVNEETFNYSNIDYLYENIIKPQIPTDLTKTQQEIWEERRYLLFYTQNDENPDYGISPNEWEELTENHLIID